MAFGFNVLALKQYNLAMGAVNLAINFFLLVIQAMGVSERFSFIKPKKRIIRHMIWFQLALFAASVVENSFDIVAYNMNLYIEDYGSWCPTVARLKQFFFCFQRGIYFMSLAAKLQLIGEGINLGYSVRVLNAVIFFGYYPSVALLMWTWIGEVRYNVCLKHLSNPAGLVNFFFEIFTRLFVFGVMIYYFRQALKHEKAINQQRNAVTASKEGTTKSSGAEFSVIKRLAFETMILEVSASVVHTTYFCFIIHAMSTGSVRSQLVGFALYPLLSPLTCLTVFISSRKIWEFGGFLASQAIDTQKVDTVKIQVTQQQTSIHTN